MCAEGPTWQLLTPFALRRLKFMCGHLCSELAMSAHIDIYIYIYIYIYKYIYIYVYTSSLPPSTHVQALLSLYVSGLWSVRRLYHIVCLPPADVFTDTYIWCRIEISIHRERTYEQWTEQDVLTHTIGTGFRHIYFHWARIRWDTHKIKHEHLLTPNIQVQTP